MKTFYTILLFIGIRCICLAQQDTLNLDKVIDKLKQEYALAKSNSERAQILMRISRSYSDSYPDSCIYYAKLGKTFAEENADYPTQILLLGFIGTGYLYKGNLPESMRICLEAIQIREKYLADQPLTATWLGPVYWTMGEIYWQIGEYKKALYYANLQISFDPDVPISAGYGYISLAKYYMESGNLDSVLIELDKGYANFSKVDEEIYKVFDVYPTWYAVRAKFYLTQNNADLALQDYRKGLRMSFLNNQPILTSDFYNDIARYFKSINQRDSSLYYAEKGLAEANKIAYSLGILNASEILEGIYESDDIGKAFYYYKLANETRNSLYGAGNIQAMRDMILQNEKRIEDLKNAEAAYQNKLKVYTLLTGLAVVLLVAFIFYRNNRKSKAANIVLENTLTSLKATQAQLIQSEKMASLGELTAGIAHEIQNPLNFVNNYSEVNVELLEELNEEYEKGNPIEVKAIIQDLTDNETKIHHHGKRADAIVRSMMQHSRTGTGAKEPTDLNALADEYLRLAYQSMKAKNSDFEAEFSTDFDETLPMVNVVQQDMGRVLLNIINNAFQACAERSRGAVQERRLSAIEGYQPEVKVATRNLEDSVEIRISDNGPGIPESIKDKIFQPFFTTKPTGQGTGLGLSLAYDIVKAHGGDLYFETREGPGTEFVIRLNS